MLEEARPVHKVWLDGAIVAPEDAKVSSFTETAMRGANVYEGMRGYWSEKRGNFFIWHLDTHVRRLFQSMKIMRMTPPYQPDEFAKAVVDWARANEFREDIHFRLVAYFGHGGGYRGFRPGEITTGAWIAGGPSELITPPVTEGILEGITRHVLMHLYERATGRKAIERAVDRTELYVADEVAAKTIFRCGARQGRGVPHTPHAGVLSRCRR